MTEKVTPTIARDVTEWYPICIVPRHAGWYEVLYAEGGSTRKRYFDVTWWLSDIKSQAASFGSNQSDKWRGLRSPA